MSRSKVEGGKVEGRVASGGRTLWTGLLRVASSQAPRNDDARNDAPHTAVAPEFTLAHGLAVAGCDATAPGLSFLPPAIQTDMRFRARKPYWITATVLGIAALLAFLGVSHAALQRERNAIAAEQSRLEQTKALRDSLRTLQDDVSLIRDRDQSMRPLMRFPSAICDILRILGDSLHPSDGLTSFTDAPNQALIIEGITPQADMTSVKALVEALQASAYVANAELGRSEAIIPGELIGRPADKLLSRFSILVTLKPAND